MHSIPQPTRYRDQARAPYIPHTTVLVIDLSSAVDALGWMDTYAAAKLLPLLGDYVGVVELNIGNARAGYALEQVAEFLRPDMHVYLRGADIDGLATFSDLLTYHRRPFENGA